MEAQVDVGVGVKVKRRGIPRRISASKRIRITRHIRHNTIVSTIINTSTIIILLLSKSVSERTSTKSTHTCNYNDPHTCV